MQEKYDESYIQGLMSEKTFVYSVLAYDSKALKPDGSGYLFERDTIIRVTARDEAMALAQARQAVPRRREYYVLEVNERI